MELTEDQYHQFQKNPEKNPITGRTIQVGKKTHQTLVEAAARFHLLSNKLPLEDEEIPQKKNFEIESARSVVAQDETKTVWVVIEENSEPNPAMTFQHYIGLYSDLLDAYLALIPHVVDNLRFTCDDLPGIIDHYIARIGLNSNSHLETWTINLPEKNYETAVLDEVLKNPDIWKDKLVMHN